MAAKTGPQLDRKMEMLYKLKPKMFSGTTDPVVAVDWLEHMKNLFDDMNCREDRKVSLAPLMLEVEEATW